jgi:multidrug efflux pump
MLALRVWLAAGAYRSAAALAALGLGRGSRLARDRALERTASRMTAPEILWDDSPAPALPAAAMLPAAAEAAAYPARMAEAEPPTAKTVPDTAALAEAAAESPPQDPGHPPVPLRAAE